MGERPLRGHGPPTGDATGRHLWRPVEGSWPDDDVLADRERIASQLRARVVKRLFATGIELVGIRARLTDGDLQDRLGSAVDELDATIRDLRRVVFDLDDDLDDDRVPEPALGGGRQHRHGTGSGGDPRLHELQERHEALEDAFVAWLLSTDKPQQLDPADGDARGTQVTWLLGVLSGSRRELPAVATEVVGMAAGTRLGDVATELLLAVNDPGGPRCRSYRAAALFLRDRNELVAVLEEA